MSAASDLARRQILLGLYPGGATLDESLPKLTNGVYAVVKRYIQGKWVYYTERFDDRLWSAVEDSWCVDCALCTPDYAPDASLTAGAASGTGVTFTSDTSLFTVANIGQILRMGGGIATITGWLNSRTILGDFTAPITEILPDDPDSTPLPAESGDWTLAIPVTTISGLNHLEGKTVAILADGSVMAPRIVVNGQITLDNPASIVVVGLPYTAQLQSMYLDVPSPATVQGRRKNVQAATIRLYRSRGMKVGSNQTDASTQQNNATVEWSSLVQYKDRGANVAAGAAIPLFTGDCRLLLPGVWRKPGQIAVEQSYPLPLTVTAIIGEWTVGDSPGS